MALLGRSPLRVESVSISMRASYSPYSAWKCAGLWSLKYIRTTIPKNRVTSGISSFDFNPFAPAPSEAESDRHAATPPPSGHLDPRDLRARVPRPAFGGRNAAVDRPATSADRAFSRSSGLVVATRR